MPKLTFLDLANKVLTEENRPLSPSEIWKVAVAKGYVSLLSSEGKTPASTLYAAIFTDARDNPDTIFVKVGARPARYFLKTLAERVRPADLEKAASAEAEVPEIYAYNESDLHPFLAYFAQQRFKAYPKTIRHSTSRRNEFGQWVHPDMIGVYYPVEDWKPEVLDLRRFPGKMVLCIEAACVRLLGIEEARPLSGGPLVGMQDSTLKPHPSLRPSQSAA